MCLLEHFIGCYGYKAELPISTTVLINKCKQTSFSNIGQQNFYNIFLCIDVVYNHRFVECLQAEVGM